MALFLMHSGIVCQSNCNQGVRQLRGCDNELNPFWVEGYQITTLCHKKWVDSKTQFYLRAYFEYKNGYLPNAGGWLDQPIKFGQVIILIDKIMAKYQKQEEEKWQTHS